MPTEFDRQVLSNSLPIEALIGVPASLHPLSAPSSYCGAGITIWRSLSLRHGPPFALFIAVGSFTGTRKSAREVERRPAVVAHT